MNEAMHGGASAGPACPEFEVLSRHADGELDAEQSAATRVHLGCCARCRAVAEQLQVAFSVSDPPREGRAHGDCLDEEHLVLFALGECGLDEVGAVTAHLAVCDGCVRAMAGLRGRVGAPAAIAVAVPASVQRRARDAFATPETVPAVPAHVASLARWRRALRAPVLIPAALAAGALLMVALRAPFDLPLGGGEERARSVLGESAPLRVTVAEAVVRSRPSRQSDIVTTLGRGTAARVAGIERDWYEVQIDGKRLGWVEREAFE